MVWSDRTTGRRLPIFVGTAYSPLISLTKLDDSSDGISKPKTVKTWLVNVFWVSVPYHKWPMNKVFLTKNISDLVTVRNSFQYQMYNKLLNLKSPLELWPVSKMISFFSVCQLTYRGPFLRNFRVKFIYSYVCLIWQKYSGSTSSSPFCTDSSLVKEILILSLHTSNAIKCIYVRQLFSVSLGHKLYSMKSWVILRWSYGWLQNDDVAELFDLYRRKKDRCL